MTHAADSAARQVTHGESVRDRVATEVGKEAGDALSGTSSHLPVFAAFDELGLTGRDVAECAGVTPPTVSKWRGGRVCIPGERLAFVTLVLAHLLDEVQATVAGCQAVEGQNDWNARLDAARAYFAYQDVLNQELAVGDVREGAQLFRVWWSSGAAKRLQEKRFAPRPGGGQDDGVSAQDEEQNMRPMI